jgi:hypothetical protein
MTTKLHLPKLDVALRQLETAVTLYFQSSDPISIHTLTAAAYNVLQDIKKHRGAGFQMFKDADMVYPEKRREYVEMLNESENFFKHADRDPTSDHGFARTGRISFSSTPAKRIGDLPVSVGQCW